MTQSTYAPLETGRRPIRDAYVQLICQAYNINAEWLRYGIEPMFAEERSKELDELLTIYDTLTIHLKRYLLKQARELRELQSEMNV
jgi:transcriptional regulator with XRE-family HTH domain